MANCEHQWIDLKATRPHRTEWTVCVRCGRELHKIWYYFRDGLKKYYRIFILDASDPSYCRKLDELKKLKSYGSSYRQEKDAKTV